MAKLVRRHPTLFGLVGALSVIGILVWYSSIATPPAHATPAAAAALRLPPPELLDPVTAGEIDALRRDTGLSNEALDVLNLNDPVTLLSDMKTWYDSNREELATRRKAIADLQGAIRLHRSAIACGQDESEALNTARTQLT